MKTKKFLHLFLFVSCMVAFLHTFAALTFAQVSVQQVQNDQNSVAFEVKNTTGGTLSLQNLQFENNSGVSVSVPSGFPWYTLLPGGDAVFEVNKNFTNLSNLLKIKSINGQGLGKFLHLKLPKGLDFLFKSKLLNNFLINILINVITSFFTGTTIPSLPSPAPSFEPSPTPVVVSPDPSPTTQSTPVTTPIQTQEFPSTLNLVEVMVCPATGQPQWVKFHNPDARSYSLNDWELVNDKNRSKKISFTIDANSDVTVELKQHLFHHTGDQLTLLRPDGIPVIKANLPACKKGEVPVGFGSNHSSTTQPQATSTSSPTQPSPEIPLQNSQSNPLEPVTQSDSQFQSSAQAVTHHHSKSVVTYKSPKISSTISDGSSSENTDFTGNDTSDSSPSADIVAATNLTDSTGASSAAMTQQNFFRGAGIALVVVGGVLGAGVGGAALQQWLRSRKKVA